MVNLVVRLLWFVAGGVTSWFITEGTIRFSIFQMMMTIVLIVALLVAAVYLPALVRTLRGENPHDEAGR